MKVLIIGESNVHVQHYCRAVRPYLDELHLLTESPLEVPEADCSYLIPFRGRNPVRWLRGFSRLRRIIAAVRPDIIHIHQVNRLAYFVTLVAEKLAIPTVVTAWGSDVLLVPERNMLYRMSVKRVIATARVVTADAQVMIQAMKGMVDKQDKYRLLQYGIDPVSPSPKEKFIYSNRLHRPLYNIDTIIRDFTDFHRRNPEWRLVIAAEGPLTSALKKQAQDSMAADAIEFKGWLDASGNSFYYSRASIFVSIPSSDGTSVSLLEAMSADCIPVVSDLPVTKEWIRDGVNGIVRKSGINPFEEALVLDRAACMEVNRTLVGSKFDRKVTTASFYEIYKEVLASQ
jgi:glycosyltransferase involved in cell wall biosynthesis